MLELGSYLIGILILIGLTFLSYWRGNAVFWMITAGIAMMVGLYSPDALDALGRQTISVGVGLLMVAFSLLCVGLAFANLFRPSEVGKDG